MIRSPTLVAQPPSLTLASSPLPPPLLRLFCHSSSKMDSDGEERAELLLNDEDRVLASGAPLSSRKTPIYLTFWWRFVHWFGFFLGGTTFIGGTACYYYPSWSAGGDVAGWLYVLGSCGFLTVDVMEFFTFVEDRWLRANIAMSMIGSAFYVIGSAGFIPAIYSETDRIGVLGFILGSAFIGCSQLWKTHRIGSSGAARRFSIANLFSSTDNFTQCGVEFDAGLGGWFFFIGTLMFNHGPLEGNFYHTILNIWMAGSVFFTLGSLFLGFRHFVMGV